MTASKLTSESSHNPDDLLKPPQRYPNLRAGGRDLALKIESHRGTPDLVVLGIALGGLLVAHEVATHLEAPLDFVVIRRLLATAEVGSHHTAVSVAGTLVTDDEIKLSDHQSSPIEHYLAEAIGGLEKRARTCRGDRPPLPLTGKNVVLVDCGIRTGSTMKVAVRALRKLAPKQIIGAVPVASREGFALIANLCDELIAVAQPEQFINAGYWYRDFRRPGDDKVGELL